MSRISFEIRSPRRLEALERVLFALACIKRVDFAEPSPGDMTWVSDEDDEFWDSMLDEEARAHFGQAVSGEESDIYMALWRLTSPKHRNHSMFDRPGPWDWPSVVSAVYTHEYLLGHMVAAPTDKQGFVEYNALAYPFGGTDALVQVVDGFGQYVVSTDHLDGPHRPKAGWDYELARALVAEGRGFDPNTDVPRP